MKRVIFIKNTLLLSATALILRFAGMIFKIWLSGKTGSEAIGLYQIIMSVYICVCSFATSGISTAVTRLVTDDLAVSGKASRKIIWSGAFLTLILGIIGFFILLFGADFISANIINDPRAALPIKILAVAVIFIGICSVFRGYFLARRKAFSSSISQITEQIVRIVVTAALILSFGKISVISATIAIVIGDVAAEIVAAIFLFIMYLADIKGYPFDKNAKNPSKEIIRIALPITSGRYLSTLLRTIESTAVPRLFVLSGMSSAAALSSFGAIKGMALPIILFPSAILSTVSLLLIPEISEAKAQKNTKLLKETVYISLKITTLVSLIVGLFLWFCGEELGILLYNDKSAGAFLKYLAPLTPLMYIDSIADGLLKGLDKQKQTFYYSVCDSAARLVLIFFILPKHSVSGFLFIMYLSNVFTAFLHFRLLLKTCKLKINFGNFLFLPALCGFSACYISFCIFSAFLTAPLIKILLSGAVGLFLYTFLLKVLGLFQKKDFI